MHFRLQHLLLVATRTSSLGIKFSICLDLEVKPSIHAICKNELYIKPQHSSFESPLFKKWKQLRDGVHLYSADPTSSKASNKNPQRKLLTTSTGNVLHFKQAQKGNIPWDPLVFKTQEVQLPTRHRKRTWHSKFEHNQICMKTTLQNWFLWMILFLLSRAVARLIWVDKQDTGNACSQWNK